MEYVEGKPLSPPLTVAKALEYSIQLAEALAAAHGRASFTGISN